MAYNFDAASSSAVDFAVSPVSGATVGPVTVAAYLRRNTISNQLGFGIVSSGNAARASVELRSAGNIRFNVSSSLYTPASGGPWSSTSVWYLIAVTWASAGTPRFHVHDGSSWTHTDAFEGTASNFTIGGTDKIRVGASLTADVVCAGVKKTAASDATVETLSRTAFQAWYDFGFDWLAGFDSSFLSGGALQDQASPGTGDETARTAVSQVSDPAGWSWTVTPAGPAFVPRIVVL